MKEYRKLKFKLLRQEKIGKNEPKKSQLTLGLRDRQSVAQRCDSIPSEIDVSQSVRTASTHNRESLFCIW